MIEQNGISRDALISVQRPFVFIGEFDATRLADSGGKPDGRMRIAFHWENGGSTPTKNMLAHVSIKRFQDVLPSDFDFPDYPENSKPFKMFVGPHATIRHPPVAISAEDMVAVQKHTGHVYWWGWARYYDTFSNVEHITRFCSELTDVVGDLFQQGNVNIQTANCERGNCWDDECKAN